jgi:hypothetical protein
VPAEFADQHPRAQFLQALFVPIEGGEQGRRLVAESDRHRLLEIAAAGHRRVAIFARKAGQRGGNRVDVRFD